RLGAAARAPLAPLGRGDGGEGPAKGNKVGDHYRTAVRLAGIELDSGNKSRNDKVSSGKRWVSNSALSPRDRFPGFRVSLKAREAAITRLPSSRRRRRGFV